MSYLFNTYLYQPILQALIFIYNYLAFQDLGIAVILLTVLIRIVFLPLFHRGTKQQMVMQRIQPAIEKIKKDHKNNREQQTRELMALYRRHGVNPLSGLLLIIVQLPIFIALYQVFSNGLSEAAFINHHFLNLIDLGNKSMIMVGLAAAAQYWQGKQTLISQPKKDGEEKTPVEQVNQMMVFIGPILTIMILGSLPAALGLFWLTTSLFSIGQQYFINKSLAFSEYGGIIGENKKTD